MDTERPREEQSPAIAAAAEVAEAAPIDGGEEEPSFSYEKFKELDSAAETEEAFSFSADEYAEAEGAGPGQQPPERKEAVSPIEKVFAAENTTEQPEVQEPAAAEEIAAAFAEENETAAEPEFPDRPGPDKKKSPGVNIIRILLLLILGVLIVAGVLVYMNGPDQLNRTIQQLFGQEQQRPAQTGRISLAELEGRFIQNEHAGELFLIRGEVINDYPDARAGIQVKGVIFDPNGKPLLQKTVFCGNPISENDLQSLSFPELEKMMGNQFGQELRNMKVDPGQAIPFDIIFRDLPQNLAEFSVKVTASKPAAN